jgi:hypothetical protein
LQIAPWWELPGSVGLVLQSAISIKSFTSLLLTLIAASLSFSLLGLLTQTPEDPKLFRS